MKVLMIVTGLEVGGAERQVCDLADEMSKLEHSVTIISLFGHPVILPSQSKVNVVSLNMSRNVSGLLRGFFHALSVVKHFSPDVVHSHMFHANIFSRFLRLLCSFPQLINSIHSTYEGGKARMMLYRLTDYLADKITNVSTEAVNAFNEKKITSVEKLTAVYNGINSEIFSFNGSIRKVYRDELGIADDDTMLLAVGRLTLAKDYPNLFRAFADVVKVNPRTILVIVGVGDLEDEIKSEAAVLSCTDKIMFLGLRVDIPQLMSAADVFVLSSAWEGFGLVVAEAMSCQRVVVATDCGGVKEVLADCGYLVPVLDSDALAKALNKAISLSDDDKVMLGLNARQQIVKNFSLQAIVHHWLNLYRV